MGLEAGQSGWRKKKKKLGYGDPGKSHQEVGVTELGSGEPERASELWRGHTHVDDDWLYTGYRKLLQPTTPLPS